MGGRGGREEEEEEEHGRMRCQTRGGYIWMERGSYSVGEYNGLHGAVGRREDGAWHGRQEGKEVKGGKNRGGGRQSSGSVVLRGWRARQERGKELSLAVVCCRAVGGAPFAAVGLLGVSSYGQWMVLPAGKRKGEEGLSGP